MVKPSQEGFKIDGTFNAGVIDFNGETVMLVRVAESVCCPNENRKINIQAKIIERESTAPFGN